MGDRRCGVSPLTCSLCGFPHGALAPCPTPEVVTLRGAVRRKTVRFALVTPCCQLTPELRGGLLHCPCGATYQALAELVRATGAV